MAVSKQLKQLSHGQYDRDVTISRLISLRLIIATTICPYLELGYDR